MHTVKIKNIRRKKFLSLPKRQILFPKKNIYMFVAKEKKTWIEKTDTKAFAEMCGNVKGERRRRRDVALQSIVGEANPYYHE